jgi:hypothetical protein
VGTLKQVKVDPFLLRLDIARTLEVVHCHSPPLMVAKMAKAATFNSHLEQATTAVLVLSVS